MKLPVSQLHHGENDFQFHSDKDAWLLDVAKGAEKKLEARATPLPLRVDLALTKLDPDYYLRGELTFPLSTECSRCSESCVIPIRHSFAQAMVRVHPARGKSTEPQEESDDLDILYFDTPDLHLIPLLEEQLILAAPYSPLCRPDCRGMCPKCGTNRNQRTCTCESDFKNTLGSAIRSGDKRGGKL